MNKNVATSLEYYYYYATERNIRLATAAECIIFMQDKNIIIWHQDRRQWV